MDWQQNDQIEDVKGFLKRLGERLGQLVILIVLCLLCVQCVNFCNRPSATIQSSDELKAYAWTQCQMLIKQSLTSPSSADFPWGIDVHVDGTTYRVASYVDAKNTFGTEIRTNFYCQLTHSGGTNFTTDELTIIK